MKWYSGLPSRVLNRGFSSAFITPLPVKARTAGHPRQRKEGSSRVHARLKAKWCRLGRQHWTRHWAYSSWRQAALDWALGLL